MKITELVYKLFRWRRPAMWNGANMYSDGTLLVIEVFTDQGIVGRSWIGGTAAERPLEDFRCYVKHYAELIKGNNPLDTEELSALLSRDVKTYGFAGAHGQVTATISNALLDIRGKVQQEPVWKLLGGVRENRRLRAYIAGGYYYVDDSDEKGLERLVEEVCGNAAQGVKAVKIKIGNPNYGLEKDLIRLKAVRDALPQDVGIMLDANCAFSKTKDPLATALRYAETCAEFEPIWLEEPFDPDRFRHYRQLAERSPIDLATGENIYTPGHFEELFSQESIRYVNADVAIVSGGYHMTMDIGRLAQAHNIVVANHGCQELQAHALAALGGESWLEIYPANVDPERNRIFPLPMPVDQDGCVTIGDEPGIGYQPDLELLTREFLVDIARV